MASFILYSDVRDIWHTISHGQEKVFMRELPWQAMLGQITEMIHVASLIHDDVLDEADTRRGGDSVHKLYSNKVLSSTRIHRRLVFLAVPSVRQIFVGLELHMRLSYFCMLRWKCTLANSNAMPAMSDTVYMEFRTPGIDPVLLSPVI